MHFGGRLPTNYIVEIGGTSRMSLLMMDTIIAFIT